MQVDDAGINHSAAVGVIDAANLVHPRQRDDDAAPDRRAATGETGARAARDNRHPRRAGEFDDLRDLLHAGRQDDDIRHCVLVRAVGIVNEQIAPLGHHRFRAEQIDEAANERCAVDRRL